ncbi:MAG: histidinol dehydrogenase [Victivallales bacterium]|nr:histidinol dehydrogenase [Victivallales bacterium]MCF7888979.1 histidinol dehydrogenase [Victivallales bacterium]
MKTIDLRNKNNIDAFDKIIHRPAFPPEIEEPVRHILKEVKVNGDSAVCKYAKEFDKADLVPDDFQLTKNEIKKAAFSVPSEKKTAIEIAITNVTEFAKRQLPKNWRFSPRMGVELGEKFMPLKRIGAYIPGGTAPLVSTAVHSIAIAKAAGVSEIVGITPPKKNGFLTPELIYAMSAAGATEIYRIGGVYGIGALAYGTESINKVEKIVGPGNAYVTAAKKAVYGDVAIDMIAGPSEIMIIADNSADHNLIASDILSQAEHGSGDEMAVLITDSEQLSIDVEKSVYKRAEKLSRQDPVSRVLKNGTYSLLVGNMDEAAETVSKLAPEHLEIICRNADAIADKVTASGAIFIGENTPEPVGDFSAGPSHVLPTGGSARYFSGLTAASFIRRTSILKYTKAGLEKEMPTIEKFAEMEGLDAHGSSALARFSSYMEKQ